MIDKLEKLLDKVRLNRGDFIDIRWEQGEGLATTIQNRRPEQITFQAEEGVGIRALIDGGWGFVSVIGSKEHKIEKGIEMAMKIAAATAKKTKEKGVIPEEYVFEGSHKMKFREDPRDISIEEKYAVIENFERVTREYSEKIVATNATFREWFQTEIVVNSLGTRVSNEYSNINLSCMATSREGDNMQNVYTAKGTTNGWEEIRKYHTTEKGEELAKRAVELLKAQKPPSGRMNVVMDQSLVGVFVHEMIGHFEEADAVLAHDSLFEGKLGQQIGTKSINLYDDPTIPGLRGSYHFDSEGTPTTKRELIKNGVLVGYLHSLETAAKMNVPPNGAGRAMSFNYRPIVRMGNTYLGTGDLSFEELLERIKDGLYLQYSYGGYVDTAKGEFYFSAQGGYVVRKGELLAPIQNVSLTGHCLEVLQKTIGVGNDLAYAFPGSCGKQSQWVPIHAGGPSLAVRDLIVGGQ